MKLYSCAPITREEMIELFGDAMPMEAVQLLWESPGEWTLAQLRAEVRRIAAEKHGKQLKEGFGVLTIDESKIEVVRDGKAIL